jgi:gas vesicle protein
MKTNGHSKLPYLLIGLGLGAIGGVFSALLARKETRESLRERSNKSLDYLTQQAGKLREAADEVAKKGKDFIGPHGDSIKGDTDAEKQEYQEQRKEHQGG